MAAAVSWAHGGAGSFKPLRQEGRAAHSTAGAASGPGRAHKATTACRRLCFGCRGVPQPMASCNSNSPATFRAVATLVKRDRHTHKGSETGRAAGALLGNSSSPTEEANIKGSRAAWGFSCHRGVRIILMKDRLLPPIPGLLPSPFHIRLQFKERPKRGGEKGKRGRAWVTDHAKDSHHLKAGGEKERGALTRELVSVARCDASVTSTRVGGSLEAWITWGTEQGAVTAASPRPSPWCPAAHEQRDHCPQKEHTHTAQNPGNR